MALSQREVFFTLARLQVIESITKLILQEIPEMMGDGVIEQLDPDHRRFLRERIGLYKGIIADVRALGSTPSTHEELTRGDAARAYLGAQDTMGHIGESQRKLRLLGTDSIEGATVVESQKTTWETQLIGELSLLDSDIENLTASR